VHMKRRDFLHTLAAGGAVVSMPALLGACAVTPALSTTSSSPEDPFLQWFGVDDVIVAKVMERLTRYGATHAELFFQHKRSRRLSLKNGVPAAPSIELIQGVGLRVVNHGRSGFAFTEELTAPSMLAAAALAADIANAGTVFPAQSMHAHALQIQPQGSLYSLSSDWSETEMGRISSLLARIESRARTSEPGLDTFIANWSDADEHIMIATLDGRLITDRRPMSRLTAQLAVTRSGRSQSGFAGLSGRRDFDWYTGHRADDLVDDALARAITGFEARRPPVGEMPVILSAGTGGILLHEAIGHSLEADFVQKGTSVYGDLMGQSVANPLVTLIDQASIAGERGALNYDDEGTTCTANVLVDKGVLRSYLHDSTTALHFGVGVTGSARRESYRYQPMPRMSCTFLENGPHTREEIIAAVDYGVVADMITDGHVTLGKGDFEFTVKNGWLVEKGKITAPVRDLTLRGNGPDALKSITMVANDKRLDADGWTCGKNGQTVPVSQGMPTVLVSSLAVGDGNA